MIDARNQTRISYRFDHVMLRVMDLNRSLAFYRDTLGMRVLRQVDYDAGQFTNVFLSFDADTESSLELTYNWQQTEAYEKGRVFGHLALMVDDVHAAVAALEQAGVRIKTPPKQMAHGTRTIAFVLDPDDNLIELLEPLSQE